MATGKESLRGFLGSLVERKEDGQNKVSQMKTAKFSQMSGFSRKSGNHLKEEIKLKYKLSLV